MPFTSVLDALRTHALAACSAAAQGLGIDLEVVEWSDAQIDAISSDPLGIYVQLESDECSMHIGLHLTVQAAGQFARALLGQDDDFEVTLVDALDSLGEWGNIVVGLLKTGLGSQFSELVIGLPSFVRGKMLPVNGGGSVDVGMNVGGCASEMRIIANPLPGYIAERRRLACQLKTREEELLQARKLEAVGQLAAGIAHEINTPIQFVGDNLTFFQEAFTDMLNLLSAWECVGSAADAAARSDALNRVHKIADECGVDYITEELPSAIERSQAGLARVAGLVRAMNTFAHVDGETTELSDLNRAIQDTAVIARCQCKSIADIEVDVTPLPLVPCRIGEINQVLINIIINAAHAIEDRSGASGELGRIRVSSHLDGDSAVISIADNGGGIPREAQSRIFDPFFTTKEVGRGTGQGLAISYAIIHDTHRGSLRFETTVGEGTIFHIRLPLADPASAKSAA